MLYEQFLELYHAGKYREALPVAEQYVSQAREQYGENHFEYAVALNNLAEIYRTQNRLDEAQSLFEQALRIEEVTLGPTHQNVAIRLYNLARLHDDRGQHDLAESLLYKALDIWEATLGPDHQQLGTALNTLAEIYVKQERTEEAESLFEHALRICENALGRDHANVARILINLAELHHQNGFPEDARPLLRRALEIEEKNLGPDHINLAKTLSKLALVYQDLDEHDERESALHRALKIYQGSFSEDHPEITGIFSDLATLYVEQERFEEAGPLAEKAFAAHKMMLGMQHPTTAIDINNIAEVMRNAGKYEEAEPRYKHAIDAFSKSLGAKHYYVGMVFHNLGELYLAQNRVDHAIQAFNGALEIYQKTFDPNHIKIALIYFRLGKILEARKDPQRAGPFYKRCIDILEKQPGPRHPFLVDAMYSLGKISHTTGRYEEAESLYKMVLKIHEETVGSKHSSVADLLLNFTSLYETQAKYEEALPLYEYALDIRKDNSVANDPSLALAHLKIANSYQKQNNWGKAHEAFQFGNKIISHCLRNGQRQFVESLAIDGIPLAPWCYIEQGRTLYDMSQKQPDDADDFRSKSFECAQWAHSISSLSIYERIGDGYDGENQSLAELLQDKMELTTKWRGNYQNLQETLAHPAKNTDKMAEATQRKLLENIDENIEHLDRSLKDDFQDFNDLFTPSSLSIAETQQQLRKDEALVHFLLGKTEGLIWIITTDDDYWAPLQIGSDQIKIMAEQLLYGLDHTLWQTMGGATRGQELLSTNFNWGDYSKGNPLPFDLTVAHNLYRELFGGVRQYIEGVDLLIVAPEPLSQIPIQVLNTDSKKTGIPGKYSEYRKISWFGQQHGITMLPSVSSLRAIRGTLEITEPRMSYLGIGKSYIPDEEDLAGNATSHSQHVNGEDKATEPLKKSKLARMANFSRGVLIDSNLLQYEIPEANSTEELKTLSKLFEAGDKEFLYGEEVSLSKFKELDSDGLLRDYGVMHFACPVLSSLRGQDLIEPAIFLSDEEPNEIENSDNLLNASEIAEMHFNANWILAPSSHSAITPETGDRYVMSLARAFMFSGAQTLLVNRWAVNAEYGGSLLKELFSIQNSSQEIGRSTALRQAISNLIQDKSRPWNPHPSTWGAYMVLGEGSSA